MFAHLGERRVELDLYASLRQPPGCVLAHSRRHLAQHLVPQLDQVDADLIVPDLWVVAASQLANETLDLADRLHSARSGTPDHEGQLRLAGCRVLFEVRAFQHLDDPIPQAEGIGQRFHSHRVLIDAGDVEGVRHTPKGHHQRVVGEPM